MTRKSSTLDDLEGHWQPVRSAILATAGFFVSFVCKILLEYARTDIDMFLKIIVEAHSKICPAALSKHSTGDDRNIVLQCYNVREL